MDHIEDLKLINWVDWASYISVFLTLAIFFYQEFSSRTNGKKEVKSIVEEIVDLVIRNHASKKIELTEVDLEFIVAGFENLRKIKLSTSTSTSNVLKMIYAKVYTNEHITTEIRKGILRDIENQISQTELNEISSERESKVKNDWKRKNEVLASIICVLFLTFAYKYILAFEYLRNDLMLTLVLIFCLLFFVIYWLKPSLSNLLKNLGQSQLRKQLEVVRVDNFEPKEVDPYTLIVNKIGTDLLTYNELLKEKKKEKDASEKSDTETVNDTSPTEATEKELPLHKPMFLYLSDVFSEDGIFLMKTILEQRFTFDALLHKIYFKVYKNTTNLSQAKILNRLYNDKILDSETFELARSVSRYANQVAHSHIPPTIDSIKIFDDILNKLGSLHNNLSEEKINQANQANNERDEDI